MARVVASEVKQILDGCTLEDVVIDVYIKSANLLVTQILGTDTTLSSDMMKEIERWYAAHMIASTLWRTVTKEKLGDASVEYTGTFGDKLNSTPYGQTVMQLDTTGKLAASGKKAAGMYAVKSFDD